MLKGADGGVKRTHAWRSHCLVTAPGERPAFQIQGWHQDFLRAGLAGASGWEVGTSSFIASSSCFTVRSCTCSTSTCWNRRMARGSKWRQESLAGVHMCPRYMQVPVDHHRTSGSGMLNLSLPFWGIDFQVFLPHPPWLFWLHCPSLCLLDYLRDSKSNPVT